MRKVYIIILTLLLGIQHINAQDSKKLESFRVKVLPGNSLYFDKADITENGQLSLSALNKFMVYKNMGGCLSFGEFRINERGMELEC
jgi:hypothetical protein